MYGLDTQMSRSGKLWAKIKMGFSGLFPALSIAAAGAAVATFTKNLFGLTKTIQGEAIRSTTVLGDQLGYVEGEAEKLAAKMGVTNREFVSMVAATGDLLIPLDFSREKAAAMATEVQSLAGALDEWTAGKYGVAEVSEILTKAMLGEMEQLKGLGIAIRQDSDEFRNLVKQKEQAKDVTNAQARAMATLELLYKKSGDAQASYMKKGNRFLRMQKSISRWWKQMKENAANYIAYTSKERLFQSVDNIDKINKRFNAEEKQLTQLITTYDKLSNKEQLTKDEQQLLNQAIENIGNIVPEAITQWDDYGKAIGISKGKIKQTREAQRLLNMEMKKGVIDDLFDQADSELSRIEELKQHMSSINDILTDRNRLEMTSSVTNKTIEETEADYQAIIRKDNELLQGRNKELAQTLLKLKDVGLSEQEISEKMGISVKQMEGIIANYMKTITNTDNSNGGKEVEARKSLLEIQKELLKDAQKMPETTEAEISAKNKKIAVIEQEIKRLKELGKEEKNNVNEALDIAHMQRVVTLQSRYAGEEALQKEFHARMLAEELAYLHAKANLETDESKKIDLQSQIISKQNEYNAAIKAAIPDVLELSTTTANLGDTMALEGEMTLRMTANMKKAQSESNKMTQQLMQQAQLYQGSIQVVSDGIFEMMSGSEDAFKSFAKNILIFALEQLKIQAELAATGVTVMSLAQPDSIATFGATGLVRAAVIIGLIEAAFAGLEGLVNKAFSGKEQGGYMDVTRAEDGRHFRAKYAPDKRGFVSKPTVITGENGLEYIIPLEGVMNPSVRPFIDAMENARQRGSLGSIDMLQAMGGSMPGREIGGSISGAIPASASPAIDAETKVLMSSVYNLLQQLHREGVQVKNLNLPIRKVQEGLDQKKQIEELSDIQ